VNQEHKSMRQAGDSSVEEILESIKKVIARDNRVSSDERRRQREQLGMPGGEDATRQPDPQIDPDDVLDLAVSAQFLDADDDEGIVARGSSDPESEALVTAESRSAMRQSLAALAMMAEPRAQPQIVRSGETSLEGLVRDILRPQLAEWLDKNLPPMVERLVAAEIARIVGKKP
jgi:cell pole-organizing protein PopZ